MGRWTIARRLLIVGFVAALVSAVAVTPGGAEEIDTTIDLSIVKDVSATTAVPGDRLVYTLTASNAGPFGAIDVYLVDTLPDGVSFISASSGCSHALGTVECAVGIMFAGDTATFTITVSIDPSASGELRNVAIVENREDPQFAPVDTNPDNDSDTASTSIRTEPTPGTIGDRVWRDTDRDGVQDEGEPGIPGVTVALGGSAGTGNAVTDANGMYLFTDLVPGTYIVAVDADTVPAGLAATTAAAVGVDLAAGETFLAADFGFGPEPEAELIDLSLTKTVSPSVVQVGDQAVFTVVLTNDGPGDATGVVVTDALPSGLTFASAAGDGSYAGSTGTWTVGSLAAGASASMSITVDVTEAGSFTNVAEVTAADQEDIDSIPGDGTGDDYAVAELDAVEILASAQIGDFVWNDLNGNAIQDSGEPGIPGVVVTLTMPAGGTDSRTTDATGKYLFAGLDAGTYTVAVDISSVSGDLSLTTPSSVTVNLADGGVFLTADFGFSEILPATGLATGEMVFAGFALLALGLVLITTVSRRRN